MTNLDKRQFSNRRIFISSCGKDCYQIFHFTQSKDGSIYVSWPHFSDTSWLFPLIDNKGNPKMGTVDFAEEGKLSIHGTGMGTFRSHKNPNFRPVIINGNKLLDLGKKEGGARHLFTAFIKEPDYIPNSLALNRKSDYLINNSEKMEPFVVIFFAIPRTNNALDINFQVSFNNDEVDVPPKSGWGAIDLEFHNVFWYVYQTHNMDKWPNKNQIFFYDGFMVPIMIGTGPGQFRLELRPPKYLFEEDKLTIELQIL